MVFAGRTRAEKFIDHIKEYSDYKFYSFHLSIPRDFFASNQSGTCLLTINETFGLELNGTPFGQVNLLGYAETSSIPRHKPDVPSLGNILSYSSKFVPDHCRHEYEAGVKKIWLGKDPEKT